ncbi:unnamed protein product [Adineta ricciae]|uniref:Uncharacterized protein n=1 Tax=Adineta ricciae TaxID=249248 RepID=A0A813PPN7_ADIRI|nr:unnamed protein product [Adineta ricciae]
MLAHIRYALVVLFPILSQVLCQNTHSQSITCYTKYDSEETRIQPSSMVLSYHYHHTETSQFRTPDNEACAQVGCVCFSYQAVCRGASDGPNHVSQCNDDDRRHGTIKWHRGWTSNAKCEEMRRQLHVYHNLTCCNTDRCNNQPGKIVKVADPPKPIPYNDFYGSQQDPPRYDDSGNPLPQRYDTLGRPSPQPMFNPYNHIQQHDSYNHQPQPQHDSYNQHHYYPYQSSSSSHTTSPATTTTTPSTTRGTTPRPRYSTHTRYLVTSRLPDTYTPTEVSDKSLGSNASLLHSSLSICMALLFFAI